MNIMRQAKILYVWFPRKRGDWAVIHEENDVSETPEKLADVKKQLKQGKHMCLVMRMERPRAYESLCLGMNPLQDHGSSPSP